jgi:hypothetical protein
MSFYSELLKGAINSIERTFARRALGILQTDRRAVLPNLAQQPNRQADFELVTWLVIRFPAG